MKAFWWFKENKIAGMARPGFNAINWFDLPLDEALAFGWFGQRTCGTLALESFKTHVREHGNKIVRFYNVEAGIVQSILDKFEETPNVREVFARVAKKTKCVEHFDVSNDHITFKLNQARLNWEIEFLKKQNIQTVVALTERHNQKEELQNHFNLHHLSIEDLQAPQFEQVLQLAEIIRHSETNKKRMVVHCLAGIGRTSTMLIAANLVLGESLESLIAVLKKQNPSFKLTGPQGDFVQSVADRVQAQSEAMV